MRHAAHHGALRPGGSKSFPVKSPFDVIYKGSLITFLNAFTGNDLTCYPFASMNDKDYFNVMHVYLDAVFNPLIYDEPRILKQEGWHYEAEKTDGPIIYKGVVYNEMKGAFSNPARELDYQVYKNLFPDNGYRFSSGGYPAAIPQIEQTTCFCSITKSIIIRSTVISCFTGTRTWTGNWLTSTVNTCQNTTRRFAPRVSRCKSRLPQ